MSVLSALEPSALWKSFEQLNAVPRPSKKEERVIAFIKAFGEGLGLPTLIDEAGNVIIKKPGSSGREHDTTIIMQSHLDMVHQKNADTNFDFLTQGIDMFIDGDWVKARGTTLGADNGIGVATIMAILSSTDISHPPVEALFTIDEETGMTGALELKGGLLEGKILLNLDTEDDDELTIGCAGGIDVTGSGTYASMATMKNGKSYAVKIKGLSGGHSGMDIHKGLGNANKLMNRYLYLLSLSFDLQVATIDGGGLRNAIPRESAATIVIPSKSENEFLDFTKQFLTTLISEYKTTDPKIELECKSTHTPESVMEDDFLQDALRTIYSIPNGIYRMSPDIKDLVQTSNNLARVLIKDGHYSILCLCRSSVDSEKMDEAFMIQSAMELLGAEVEFSGTYPGWTPNPDAKIVSLMKDLYQEMFDTPAHVAACHAGLECGILGTNYPEVEMISFGPNIRGAHSPDEKVQISSVQKYWGFLLETLKRIS